MTGNRNIIDQAVQLLQAGELVAFPTETVYGLGADASNPTAIGKLYAAKGRPGNHPVIVHLAELSQLNHWASHVPENAVKLAERFWPGPLTLILAKADHVLDQITGGQKTVGLRMPNHPLAIELLKAFGGGVVAPSANKFGRLSPTRAEDVQSEFSDQVALVLDGGPCEVGIESTIVDLSKTQAMILRPGMIDQAAIEAVIGAVQIATQVENDDAITRAPGGLPSHYAPITPLKILSGDELHRMALDLPNRGVRVAVMAFSNAPVEMDWIVANRDPQVFARELYNNLRRLDKLNLDQIIVEALPADPHWDGIRDRLTRAATRR